MPVALYWLTWYNNPEDLTIQEHGFEKFESDLKECYTSSDAGRHKSCKYY